MNELDKKATTVAGQPTGDYTESGNPAHNSDGKFGSKGQSGGEIPSSRVLESAKDFRDFLSTYQSTDEDDELDNFDLNANIKDEQGNWELEIPFSKTRYLNWETKQILQQKLNLGTKEAENILGTFLLQSALYIRNPEREYGESSSCYNVRYKEVAFKKEDFKVEMFEGELAFHELSHSLDDLFQNHYQERTLSNSYVSSKHRMTMKQSLKEEFEEFKNKNSINIVKEQFSKEEKGHIRNYLNSVGSSFTSLEEISVETNKLIKSFFTHDKKIELYRSGELKINQKTGKFTKVSVRNVAEKYVKGFKELNDLYNKAQEYGLEKTKHKYHGISDCMSKIGESLGWSHPAEYWSKKNDGDGNNHVSEFFASLGASRFCSTKNGKENYQLLKEYFPRTVEIFEEIIGKLNNKTNIKDMRNEFSGRMEYYDG